MQYIRGKSILLTRNAIQNRKTADLVASLGAKPILFPCSTIQTLREDIKHAWTTLSSAPADTDIIFSSQNGVNTVASSMHDFKQVLRKFRIIAVGKKTAEALETQGLHTSWMPNHASQQGLIADYPKHGLPQHAVFFRAETGSDVLLNFLNNQSIPTTLAIAYKATLSPEKNTPVIQQLQEKKIDAVLLGSARTTEFYIQKVGDLTAANHPVVVVMSPQVEKAADKLGLNVQVIAKQPSFKAMLEGLNDYFATMEKG